MARGFRSGAIREIATLYHLGPVSGLTDAQLLRIFVDRRDSAVAESAFAVLVERHGPMILRLCRQHLDPHAAEDAFQAVFLVLARRASSIRHADSLASWLFGVSLRIARRASTSIARRRRAENQAAQQRPESVAAPSATIDRELLEEIDRLPEKYRSPLILCHLEGLTYQQAATRLGCPVRTLQTRLRRGRDRLKRRLIHRGFALLATGSLWPSPTTAAVPGSLISASVKLALRFGVSPGLRLAAGSVPASAALLAEGFLRRIIMTKLAKTALVLLSGGLLLTGGTALFAWQDDRFQPANPRRVQPLNNDRHLATVPADKPSPSGSKPVQNPRYPVNPPDLISVEVLETLPDRPIDKGERLVRPDGTITLGFYGDVYVAGLTTPEIKAGVIQHLQQFLTDEQLGLIGPDGKQVPPEKSTNVAVDVIAYNSRYYYIQGAAAAAGRLPVTGHDTVLDALNYGSAVGQIEDAPSVDIRLVRPREGQSSKVLKVDLVDILAGDDSTNYLIEPNDRLIVTRHPQPSDSPEPDDPETILRNLDTRLKSVESKLDRLLELLADEPGSVP